MKIVIVGGVTGGATAAARIRRLDEKAEIVIFERTGFICVAMKKLIERNLSNSWSVLFSNWSVPSKLRSVLFLFGQ